MHQAGALAVVDVDAQDDAGPISLVVLLRADALPALPSLLRCAAQLRAQYGESLTVGQVAAAGVVTPTAIYHALGRGRIAGTKQHGGWTFTPEQAAAWLVRRGRVAT